MDDELNYAKSSTRLDAIAKNACFENLNNSQTTD